MASLKCEDLTESQPWSAIVPTVSENLSTGVPLRDALQSCRTVPIVKPTSSPQMSSYLGGGQNSV